MRYLLLLASVLVSQAPNVAAPIDVSAVKFGRPTVVAELDLGKLKGEPRRVSWSADGAQLYIQTADGNPPSEKLRHYVQKSGRKKYNLVWAPVAKE